MLLGVHLPTSLRYCTLCELGGRGGRRKGMHGTCATFIGPLAEDQVFIPVELEWPDGRPTVVERLENIQSTLSLVQ